ncbi:BatA domain-containing protein [Verrucomicrobiota bacterium sgz303538]
MPDQFANPLGFLGLFAIPMILTIHLLREKSRRVKVSTLFLLERLEPRTPTGRTIHRLQNSIPLWLQLLIALLCTWLLVQPLWLRADSRQRVTVVLDPTASMSAARSRVLEQLPPVLREMSRAAAQTDWVLFTADRPESPLYRGGDIAALENALGQWQPLLPSLDPSRAFSVALLDARGGPVLFVSDRAPDTLPAGVTLMAFGEGVENCGFAGVRTWRDRDGAHFEALVRNAGAQPQEREWWIETERFRSQPQRVVLQPGQIATLPGPFPAGEKQIRVQLSPDAFVLDDVLPLISPEPKPLLVSVKVGANATRFADLLLATIPGVQRVADPASADVVLTTEDRVEALPPNRNAVIFGTFAGSNSALTAAITTEQHSLTEGANWNGLLSPGPNEVALQTGDEPLVWQQGKPLVVLNTQGNVRRLHLCFDFEHSNADRFPAAVLLVSRFLVETQERKVAPFAENFETHQALPVPANGRFELVADQGAGERSVPGTTLRAPLKPGFFSVRSEAGDLLRGAARFGDPREADFRGATSTVSKLDRAKFVRRENLTGDRWGGVWLATVAAALVGSWFAQIRMART